MAMRRSSNIPRLYPKLLLVACWLMTGPACKASSLEESYLKARDGFIAKVKDLEAAKQDNESRKQQSVAEAELTKLLQPVVGTVSIKGFATMGKANISSLSPDYMGFGILDGLRYPAPRDKGFLIATTEALLRHWLVEHKDWWGEKTANVPQQIDAALQWDQFYTQALQTDAAISRYADLPVRKPAGAKFAQAMLVARSQVLDPRAPDELLVTLTIGGRVLVVSKPAAVKVKPMPVCDKIWKDAQREAIAAQEAYIASDLKDKGSADRRDKMDEDGASAFHRCFAQRAGGQDFFAPLVRQAQTLIDEMAIK
jgi:hypothetical protein